MSSIVAKAKQYHKADIIIQHFFNSRGQALEHSFDGFLRSLLEQILRREPSLIQYMVEEWRATQEQSPDFPKWTLPLLKEALMKVLVHGSQYTHFLLILDALDEYDGLRGEMDILSFLSMVNTSSKSSHLRIVFSCRYSPDIGIPNIMGGFRMEQRNEADITSLVNDEWSLIFPPDSMTEELHEVKRTIIQKADGVFLWVRLALQGVSGVVREGGTVAEIKETIDDIPSELSNMYEMLLSRVGDKHKKETYLMLSVVLASRRPLTLTEFKLVMGLCTGEFECLIDMERSNTVISNDSVMQKRIRSRSGGLLEVKATGETWRQDAKAGRTMNGGIVQLIHQSVKDFLLVHEEDTKSTFPNQDRLVANGHEKLAQACLRYLKMREISSLQRQWVSTANESVISEEYPLLFYSISNWRWHCQQAERLGLPQVDLIRQTFDFETGTFSHWLELYNALCPAEPLSTDYTLYQLAVHDNLATLLEYFCKTGELDVNAWTEAGNKSTYLFHAVSEGCKESVKVLLEYGANPDAGGLEHGTPILLACVLGYVDIARMLLEAGAEFQGGLDPYGLSSEFPGFAMLYRPIAMAAYSGNADVINLIIQYDPGAVVNHWHRQYAVLCLVIGAKEAVESFPEKERESQFLSRVSKLLPLLLGGDYSETEIFDSTMILYVCAVRGYSKKSLDMFLNTQYASRAEGFTKMIAQICSHGPLSALQYLVEYCSVEMVQNMMIEDYGNLLHAAVFNPHTSVIVYLLDLGLDIDAQDSSGQTPLHYASARSSGAHIELLLTRGADGTIRDNQGFTAFHLALMNPYLRRSISILEQLMSSSKEDAHSSSRDGVKPLHLAAAAGWLPTVEWLLKNGADIKCSDDLGRTALHTAASSMGLDSIDIVKFLINHGLSATDQDEGGMTPLHHVFYTYDKLDPDSYDPDVSLVIARYLLQQGADPAIQDSEGNTVLHLAAWRGHVGIVKTLIQSGVDTSVTNNANQKPIDNAWSEDIRKLLEL
jgi:ankyrin repeat protein